MVSVAPKHYKDFVPMALKDGYPTPLGQLYEAENVGLTYNELDKCDKVFKDLLITDAQCKVVEQKTKGQASSRMWCTYRCGRLTATKFGAVIKSNDNQPPKSLVKAICYPESAKFITAAIRYYLFILRVKANYEVSSCCSLIKRMGLCNDKTSPKNSCRVIMDMYVYASKFIKYFQVGHSAGD